MVEALPADVRRFVEHVQRLAPGSAPADIVLRSLEYTEVNRGPLITEEEYQALLSAMMVLGRALERSWFEDEKRWGGMQGLMLELHALAVSAWVLYLGVPAQDGRRQYDPSGLAAVARTALEAAVAFNSVFVRPAAGSEDSELRFRLWLLAGTQLFLDPGYPQHDDAARQARAEAEQTIAEHGPRIEELLTHLNWKPRRIASTIRRGDWRLGRRDLTYANALIGPVFARHAFAFLSSHVHADSLAAKQVLVLRTHPEQWDQFVITALRTVAVAMARTVADVVDLIPELPSHAPLPLMSAIYVVYHSDLAVHWPLKPR